MVILGYGNKILNLPHKAISYMNEAAYPIYIVHQTVLVIISYYILRLNFRYFTQIFYDHVFEPGSIIHVI